MDQLPPEQLARLAGEDKGLLTRTVVIVFTVLAFICVCLRFLSRIQFTKCVGLEDYFIAVSMCFSIVMAVCQVYEVKWGYGKHMMFLDLVAAVNILKYLYWSILAYCTSLTLTKLSILIQYRRIFAVESIRIPIYIIMGICVAFGIEAVLAGIFTCVPVDAFWDVMKKPTARCVNEIALWYANAGLSIATDLLVAALPVKSIWSLQIPKRQKTVVLIILTIGWFVCIVSILRLIALTEMAKHPEDTTWYGADGAYWSAIETNLAIVCASTPALKPLVVKIIPAFSSRHGPSAHTSSSRATNSKNRKSFIEIDDSNNSQTTFRDDLEMDALHATTRPTFGRKTPGRIHVTREVVQQSMDVRRTSESESQKDLVSKFPNFPKALFKR